MEFNQYILPGALTFNLILGLAVYLTNQRRKVNRLFLFFSLMTALWLFSMLMAFHTHHNAPAVFWMRAASLFGGILPLAFTFLRLNILHEHVKNYNPILQIHKAWIAVYIGIAILCFSPQFISHASFPLNGVPDAHYGSLAWIYQVYMISSFLWVTRDFARDIRTSQGLKRSELQYILLGLLTLVVFGVFFAVIYPILTGNSKYVGLAPIWVILMNSLMAYGIATQRIMGVGVFVRRSLSYLLLFVYLATVYSLSWFVTQLVLQAFSLSINFIPDLVGAIVVGFSMSHARTRNYLQIFINRLFIQLHEINLQDVLKTADTVFTTVTTTDDLIRRFKETVTKVTGTDFVDIHLFENHPDHSSLSAPLKTVKLTPNDSLTQFLKETGKPLLVSAIHRAKRSSLMLQAGKQLTELNGSLAVGIQTGSAMIGVVILGERLSGRIYDSSEQEALQILINRFAVALENSRLYTEIQNAKVYNDILLDNLISGIIAVNQNGIITVINREALRIVGKSHQQVFGKDFSVLPNSIETSLRTTLQKHKSIRDEEIEFERNDGSSCTIRLGSSVFGSKNFESLGALVVLHDVSAVKELEMHVQHTERLATIGKLSATMAHEIKNPLVAIKTFAQLIQERKEDPEFLAHFSKVVNGEVERINRTVSELLGYARMGDNLFQPIHAHEAIQRATGLLKPQMEKKRIELIRNLEAPHDLIMANHDRFQQILVNLLLNACEAIEAHGKIFIETGLVSPETQPLHGNGSEYFLLQIRDTGKGISPQDLKRIFDPFFTTKKAGTGLGLSLTSSLVAAHKGTMDVESTLGQGTSFRLQFPLKPVEATP